MAVAILVDTDGVTGDYASLDAAIDALNVSGLADDTVITCQASGDVADTTAVSTIAITLNGHTLRIQAAAGDHASLSWSTTKYRLALSGATMLTINTSLTIEGIQIDGTATSGTQDVIKVANSAAVTIDSCLIRGAGIYGRFGLWASTGAQVTCINSCWYNFNIANTYGIIYADTATSDVFMESCLIYAASIRYCIQTDNASAVITCYNTICRNTSDGYDCWVGTGALASGDYNCGVSSAGDDTSAPGAGSVDKTPANVAWVNVTAGSEDFHLQATSQLIGIGTDRTAQGFSDDMDGIERGVTWDIGPDEYAAAGGGVGAIKRFGGVPHVAVNRGVW
jgi:hypothetical protein